MSQYLEMWSDYGSADYADFDLDRPIYEHFSGVAFFSGVRLGSVFPPTRIVLEERPKPPDYLTVGSVEIVSGRLRRFFESERVNAEFIDIELIQGGERVPGDHVFMNALDLIKCLDRKRSIFEEFPPDAGGGILTIDHMVLDESRIGGSRLFVLDDKVMFMVRRDLADALRGAGFTGVAFKQLPTGPF